jgi:hypothetical protein
VGTDTLTRTDYIVVNEPPPQLALGPTSLNFGGLLLGQTNMLSFQFTNVGGLTLTGSVSTASPFWVEGASSFILAPGQTGQALIGFSPSSAGSYY